MKSLEEEALKHTFKDHLSWENDYAKEAFIAGANSKWVQAEKIKAQIEVLKEIISSGYKFRNALEESENKLSKLQQQLKQLEDGETL